MLNSIFEINLEDIILNNEFLYKDVLTENYVSQQLNINFENIYYWRSNNIAEIDFIKSIPVYATYLIR